MIVVGYSRAPKGVSELSLQATATASGDSITIPASTQEGDLIVLLNAATVLLEDSVGVVVPTGFTLVDSAEGDFQRITLLYKVADSDDGGSSVTGMTFRNNKVLLLLVFRGNVPISTASHFSEDVQVSDGVAINDQNITAASGSAPLVVIAGYCDDTGSSVPSLSPSEDGGLMESPEMVGWLRHIIYNSSPSDVTAGFSSQSGANTWGLVSCYIQVSA